MAGLFNYGLPAGLFGAGFNPNAPDPMQGVSDALVQNALTPAPAEPNYQPHGGLRGFLGNVVGSIGDAVAVQAGGQPLFAQDVQQRRKLAAFQQKQMREQEQLRAFHQAVDADPNLSPQEKAYAKAAPEEFAKRYVERFGTHDVNAGDTLISGMGGGRRDAFTAPKFHEVGPDLLLTDPSGLLSGAPMMGDNAARAIANGQLISNEDLPSGMREVPNASPMVQTVHSGRLDAERYADSLGFERGTKDWGQAVRDFALREYGPTAVGAKRELREMENRQSDINNQRTTDAARFNRANTPVATMTNERGEVVAAYPTGRVTTFRNSRPGSGGGGGRGRQGGAGRAAAEGTVIRNPQTGQKLVRRNGQWVPLR